MADQSPGGSAAAQRTALDKRLKEAGLAAWLVTLLGSASLSAFLSTLVEDPAEAAGVGEFKVLFTAALAGLALTLGAAFAWAALKRGEYQGHAAGTVAALCMLAGITLANAIGIGSVSWEVVQEQLSAAGGPPIQKALALTTACFITYGVVASLQACKPAGPGLWWPAGALAGRCATDPGAPRPWPGPTAAAGCARTVGT